MMRAQGPYLPDGFLGRRRENIEVNVALSARIRGPAMAMVMAATLLMPRPLASDPPWESIDDIICRAQSGVGFSYWWGGECWCRSGCSPNFACGAGGCSGSCPSCTHWGSYGADCSGFVTKVWQVPNPIGVEACHVFRYVASNFRYGSTHWYSVSRDSLQRADALASSSHVFLYESGNGWGSMWVYEALGCAYGIVHRTRTASGSYTATRRNNISVCQCSPGETQTEGCGNCGRRTRTCGGDCRWGGWSACLDQGPCTPGADETRGCGDCGWQSRTCQSNCQWGGWSSCFDQGPCSPGDVDSRSCCDCGAQSRSCGADCEWGGWGACAGPDPDGGTRVCDTGECGPCADGKVRCVEGCLACVRAYEPIPELCDDIDNDCNCDVDDGGPTEMGDPPPQFAAMLIDFSYPGSMAEGETAGVWAEFVNMGYETWRDGDVWLVSTAAAGGEVSRLYAEDGWSSWDTPAVLRGDVRPGDAARFAFGIKAPEAGAGEEIADTFILLDHEGEAMRCPGPDIAVKVLVKMQAADDRDEESPSQDNVEPEDGTRALGGGCGCMVAR